MQTLVLFCAGIADVEIYPSFWLVCSAQSALVLVSSQRIDSHDAYRQNTPTKIFQSHSLNTIHNNFNFTQVKAKTNGTVGTTPATSARKGPTGGEIHHEEFQTNLARARYVVLSTASHCPVGSSIGGRLQRPVPFSACYTVPLVK